jgi:SynChlorMet cassette protein ScmD
MKDDEKPIANPLIVLREEFDDWAILFDPDTGNAFGLSPTGVHLWKHLDGEHSMDDLLEDIRHHTDNIPEGISDHIKAFVDALVAHGLAGFDVAQLALGSDFLNAADSAELHPEKFSYAPPGQAGEVKRFAYEPPKLINLNQEQAAYGANCTTGSQATNRCNTGNLACDCSTGTSGAYACCEGSCIYTVYNCCCGECPQNATQCNHGGYPENCYCYAGSGANCECIPGFSNG